MDKLTWYAENGQVYCRRGYEVALARLASYEATGLSPDEVTKMGMMFEDSKRYSGRLELKLDALSEKIPQWIPVTERLPRDRGNVLVVAFWHERWGVYMGWCAPERAEWSVHVGLGDRSDVAVTHWMPLPEPPVKEGNEKMIDFGDCTWYCHWDKGLICKRQFQCDGCKHQPADEDKENGKADPVHIRWSEDYDGSKVPECPSCGQMPYSVERCFFCGQKFLPDAVAEELGTPPEEVHMDCFNCGGKGTLVGTRDRGNGHFHGRCTSCGCVMME